MCIHEKKQKAAKCQLYTELNQSIYYNYPFCREMYTHRYIILYNKKVY